MSINRNNYEAYLLDLSEGNLSDELRSELNSFLAQNPDLESDLIDEISTLDSRTDFSMDRDSLNFESINNSNRNHFFIAYHEGDLSTSEQNEVLAFISENNMYKKEFDSISKLYLKASTDVFADKKFLHALADSANLNAINESNRTDFFIAYHEGDLSTSEQNEVLEFVSENEVFKQEFNSFSKSYLKASNLVFEDKKSLHDIATTHNSRGIFYWSLRIAAIFLIGFLLNNLYENTTSTIEVKYTLSKNDSNLKPTLQSDSELDFSEFFKSKAEQELNTNTSVATNYKKENSTEDVKNKNTDSLKTKMNRETPIKIMKDNELKVINRNPSLDRIIADIHQDSNPDKNNVKEQVPVKNIETPPSLLAYLGEKAKEKKILTDKGRPDLVSLLNKGSNSISGQDILATSETEKSNSTIFQLGNFKIERITKK